MSKAIVISPNITKEENERRLKVVEEVLKKIALEIITNEKDG